MGIMYYGVCHTCKQFIDLDKFYSFAPWRGDADINAEDLEDYKTDGYIFRSLRLQYFLSQHQVSWSNFSVEYGEVSGENRK